MSRQHPSQQDHGPFYASDATLSFTTNREEPVNRIFESVAVAEQGLDPALAVLRLTRRFSAARVEAAAGIALASRVRSPRYAHLRPILDSRQDAPPAQRDARPQIDRAPQAPAGVAAGFVRGAEYYAGGKK